MRFTKIELQGYFYLMLKGINRICITPENPLQLILGPNGSGKSSLLRQITPMPAHHGDFQKGGYKYLEFTHRGDEYKLLNKFDGGTGTFSFIKNGVEQLNKSMTASAYKELVWKEFKLNDFIFAFITGRERFSTMDVSKRRFLITQLSTCDYSFALKYFQKLSSLLRDHEGSIKRAQKRLLLEQDGLLSEDEMTALRARRTSLNVFLEEALSLRRPTVRQEDIIERLTALNNKIDTLSTSRIANLLRPFPGFTTDDPKLLLRETETRLATWKDRQKNIHAKLNEVDKHLNLFDSSAASSVSELEQRYTSLRQEYDKLTDSHKPIDPSGMVCIFVNAEADKETLIRLKPMIANFAEEMADLAEVYNDVDTRVEGKICEDIGKSNVEKQSETMRIRILLERMEADKEHVLICKNCGSHSHRHYDETAYKDAQEKLKRLTAEIEHDTALCNRALDRMKGKSRLLELHAKLTNLQSVFVLHPTNWEIITHPALYLSAPRMLPNVIGRMIEEADIAIQRAAVVEKTCIVAEALKTMRLSADKDREGLLAVRKEHEEELWRTEKNINAYQTYERNLRDYVANQNTMRNFNILLKEALVEKNTEYGKLLASIEQQALSKVIGPTQTELSRIDEQLSKQTSLRAVIKSIEEQIATESVNVRLLSAAVKELSPKEGLIAQGLTGFINYFINLVNNFIQRVWSYRMVLLPIEQDDGNLDLDYKFPVKAEDMKPAADISLTSGGMSEFIDLAIRIVGMALLGMNDYPLQLDEFGDRLDSHHKTEAFKFIMGLMENTDFPQFFMVSHTEVTYGSLRNADLVVLHSDNIILPKGLQANKSTVID